ncbi:adenosylcobinamide-GDP ribazoletransferase [Aureivirga sp. CE67]|uniref:adenosylcobinamide-GDP ribazoletransferase n=1 Tax=Aureivirga sp. CE67 TaxID=1788983 RepID=UPI0018CACD69|nr:adenosylcobinamide-GDP ribazoletransferase [Aureivirga sp. CE67]
MKKELDIFFTALMFFTRIPCPKWIDHSSEILNKSTRYFSIIGFIVGGISALIFYGSSFLFPTSISIIISMISSIWITGAFHEDGFADVCDGFGGGWTKEKILTIMKDSRLGTYGTVGLIGILALKYLTLSQFSYNWIIFAIISGHMISRFFATGIIYFLPYVQDIDKSKVKPSADRMPFSSLFVNAIFGIGSLFLFQDFKIFLVLISMTIATYLLGRYYKKWIGGHTGDCAGAAQQINEIVFYLSIIAIYGN